MNSDFLKAKHRETDWKQSVNKKQIYGPLMMTQWIQFKWVFLLSRQFKKKRREGKGRMGSLERPETFTNNRFLSTPSAKSFFGWRKAESVEVSLVRAFWDQIFNWNLPRPTLLFIYHFIYLRTNSHLPISNDIFYSYAFQTCLDQDLPETDIKESDPWWWRRGFICWTLPSRQNEFEKKVTPKQNTVAVTEFLP